MFISYIRLIGFVSALCLLVGFILPWFISAKSTIAIFLGFAIIVLVPAGIWKWRKLIEDDINKLLKGVNK